MGRSPGTKSMKKMPHGASFVSGRSRRMELTLTARCRVEAGFFWCVLESELLDVQVVDGPIELGPEVFGERGEVADLAKLADSGIGDGRGHESSIHAVRTGSTPMGAFAALR